VLILGESGTGKELSAGGASSQRAQRRGDDRYQLRAISANLIESEFRPRARELHPQIGSTAALERADGGTLFLDEICEMPKELQVKLLRVLESGTFTRVGGDRSIRVNVRIIAAAKADLENAAAEGRFRADLLYRLKVMPILLPPLRQRGADLERLARHVVGELNLAGEPTLRNDAEALEVPAHDGRQRASSHVSSATILRMAPSAQSLSGSRNARSRAQRAPPPGFQLRPGISLEDAARVHSGRWRSSTAARRRRFTDQH
jgi:transcriptional regulator with GAF, ATPase, and Fis domain